MFQLNVFVTMQKKRFPLCYINSTVEKCIVIQLVLYISSSLQSQIERGRMSQAVYFSLYSDIFQIVSPRRRVHLNSVFCGPLHSRLLCDMRLIHVLETSLQSIAFVHTPT